MFGIKTRLFALRDRLLYGPGNFRLISRIGHDSPNLWIRKSSEVQGWLYPGEHEFLYNTLSCSPKGHALEIGSLLGKSTCILAGALIESSEEKMLFAIDPFTVEGDAHDIKVHKQTHGLSNTFPSFIDSAKRLGYAHRVIPMATYSYQAIPFIKAELAFAFIDGLHEYDAVRNDFALIRPLLVPGATVVFHDAKSEAFPGVAKAIDRILADNPDFTEFEGAGTMRMIKHNGA